MNQYLPEEMMKIDEDKRKTEYLAAINRKRTMPIDDAHSLQTKISKEATKIIKMKVATDAVIWELKEQAKENESVRERQKQNLLQIQMQYEKLGGDFQKELRLREDLKSSVINTRSICDILQEHFAALGRTLATCQADRQTLCESYQRAVEVINNIKAKYEELETQYSIDRQNLQHQLENEKQLRILSENNWSELKISKNETIDQLKNQINNQLGEIAALKNHLDQTNSTIANIKQDYEHLCNELKQRDQAIASLQLENNALNKTLLENRVEKEQFKQQYEEQIRKEQNEVAINKEALSNQDSFIATINKEKMQLNEKICTLEDTIRQQNAMINDENEKSAQLKSEMDSVKMKNIELQNNESAMEAKFINQQNDIEEMRQKFDKVCDENQAMQKELEKFQVELQDKQMLSDMTESLSSNLEEERKKRQALETDLAHIKKQFEILQDELNKERSEGREQINMLTEEANKSNSDRNAKSDIIKSLMAQVKSGTDTRSKLEMSLASLNKEMDSIKISNQNKLTSLDDNNQLLKREIGMLKDFTKKLTDENVSLKRQLKKQEKSQSSIHGDITNKSKEKPAKTIDSIPKISEPVKNNKDLFFYDDGSNHALNNGNMTWTKTDKLSNLKPSKPKTTTAIKYKHSQDFLSDSSIDGYVFDPARVERHFKDLAKAIKSPMQANVPKNYPLSQISILSTQDSGAMTKKRNIRSKPSQDKK